jgi:hypothetical protein
MSNTLHVVLSTRSRPWIPSARTHLALIILTLPQPPPAAAHWTLRRVCARALASAANGRGSSRDRGVEAAADAGDEARVSEEEESEAGVAEEAMLARYIGPAVEGTSKILVQPSREHAHAVALIHCSIAPHSYRRCLPARWHACTLTDSH